MLRVATDHPALKQVLAELIKLHVPLQVELFEANQVLQLNLDPVDIELVLHVQLAVTVEARHGRLDGPAYTTARETASGALMLLIAAGFVVAVT